MVKEILNLEYDGVPLRITTDYDGIETEDSPKRGEAIDFDGTGWFIITPDGSIDFERLHESSPAHKSDSQTGGGSVQAAADYRPLRVPSKPTFTAGDPRRNPKLWEGQQPDGPDYLAGEKPLSYSERMMRENRRRSLGNWKPPKDSRVRFIPLKNQRVMSPNASPLSGLRSDGQVRNKLTAGSPHNPATADFWEKKEAKR
jgi:hypothetical protein